MKFGDKLRRLRTAKGFSQQEVAKAIHMDRSVYNRLENDKIESPSIDTMIALGKLYGISLDSLCDFDVSETEGIGNYELALVLIKEMGVNFKVVCDVVELDIYGVQYRVNIKDLSELVKRANSHYKNMLVDFNKGLYNSALIIELNNRSFTQVPVILRNSSGDMHYRIDSWLKDFSGDITPDVVLNWTAEYLIVLSSSDRKRLWNLVIKEMFKMDLISKNDIDKGKWECPIIEF